MIAEIRKGNCFEGALFYNLKKIQLDKAVPIGTSGFKTAVPTFEQVLREFKGMLVFHPVKKPVWHTSLNFAPGEYLDDTLLVTIVKEYMDKMGLGKSPYAIFRHTDTHHLHVHVLSINLHFNEEGKLRHTNDSYDFFKSKKICKDIERKYGLVVSEGRSKTKERSYKVKEPEFCHYGEVPTFEYLKEVVDYILSSRKPIHHFELNQLLRPYSVAAFDNVSKSGERYFKFTFIDKNGKELGVGGSAKKLRLNYSSKEIVHLFENNREELKSFLNNIRKKSRLWLKEYYAVSQRDLELKLKAEGLRFVDDWIYCDEKTGRPFEVVRLGIPGAFIKSATIRRDYFKTFMRTVTAFRHEAKIFYESTLLQNPKLLAKLKAYCKLQLNTLSRAQVNVLFDDFIAYKSDRLQEITEKEKVKDIVWINKAVAYVNSLNIDYLDRLGLLEKLGISFFPQKCILHNRVDQIEHIIDRIELLPVNELSNKGIAYASRLKTFTDIDTQVIRAAISGKYIFLPEANYTLLMPFLPGHFISKLPRLKQQFKQNIIHKNLSSALWPTAYDLRPGKLLKWEDEEEDEEEEENTTGKKHRKRR